LQHFNVGFAAAIPAGANPTPIPFALIDGLTIGVKPEYATYDGQWIHTKVVALKSAKTSGKIDTIQIFAGPLAQIFGATPSAGSQIPVIAELKTGLSGAAYTVANGATFATDCYVLNLSDGIQMTRVASGPTAGQYSVNTTTGAYTFNATDNGKNFAFTYTYTSASVGKTLDIVNTTGGIVTGFQLVGFAPSTNGKPLGVKVYNAFFDDYSLTLKADDFVKKGLSWFAAEDPTTQKVMTQWTGE
jgi:hypothetical protein